MMDSSTPMTFVRGLYRPPFTSVAALAAVLAAVFLLSACGGGAAATAEVQAPKAVSPLKGTLAAVSSQSQGAICVNGGAKIESGIDVNGNGVLDPAEVTSTQYVCNGTPGQTGATGSPGAGGPAGPAGAVGSSGATGAQGAPGTGSQGAAGAAGLTSLVKISGEPAGANCPASGSKIQVGFDVNGNRILDSVEVTSTGYVCSGVNGVNSSGGASGGGPAGPPGVNGLNGTDGLTSLVAMVPEPVGANCSFGGSRVNSGLDLNGTGALDPVEITASVYLCNPVPAFEVVEVTAGALQALPNKSYLANSPSLVAITLPVSPKVGDTLRVAGVGSGGFKLAQNSGQSIKTRNLPGNFSFDLSGPVNTWQGIVANFDGTRMYATSDSIPAASGSSGGVYTSADAGLSWVKLNMPGGVDYWRGIATSADGKNVATANGSTGAIFTSNDFGVTWTNRGQAGTWTTISMSASGAVIFAAQASGGQNVLSTDGGVSFAPVGASGTYFGIAVAAEGAYLYAAKNTGLVFKSTDSGASWASVGLPAGNWAGLAASANGKYIAVIDLSTRSLYQSSDFGLTWKLNRGVLANGTSVSMSADGKNVFLTDSYTSELRVSLDFGLNFLVRGGRFAANYGAVSGDGSKFIATDFGSRIAVSSNASDTTTPGTAGYLSGSMDDAIELQYLGGGVFGINSFSAGSASGSFTVR